MNIIEGRQKAHAKSKSKQIIKEADRQLRLAECLVRVFEEITAAQLDRFPPIAQKHLSQISSDLKLQKLSDAKISNVCLNLRAYQIKWQAIDVEESMELQWNQKFPTKSLLV